MAPTPAARERLARYGKVAERAMFWMAIAVIPVYTAQGLTEAGPRWATALLAGARVAIHVAMAVDVTIRTWLSSNRRRFVATHKLELVAIAVPPIRTLREVASLHSILLRPGLQRFTAFAIAAIVASAGLVYVAERGHEGATIDTIGEATWWAASTATTVGYGDHVPVTVQGRAVAVLLMVAGITLFAVVTAHVAAYFVDADRRVAVIDTALDARLERIEEALRTIERQLSGSAPGSDPGPLAKPGLAPWE